MLSRAMVLDPSGKIKLKRRWCGSFADSVVDLVVEVIDREDE